MIGKSQNGFIWNEASTHKKNKTIITNDVKGFIDRTLKTYAIFETGDSIMVTSEIKKNVGSMYYKYKYNLTISVTESTYKVTINNLYCSEAFNQYIGYQTESYREIEQIAPFENECPSLNMWGMHPSCKDLKAMMESLKADLTLIFINTTKTFK